MRNEYISPEVIEVGRAGDVILGEKVLPPIDDLGYMQIPDNDLDD